MTDILSITREMVVEEFTKIVEIRGRDYIYPGSLNGVVSMNCLYVDNLDIHYGLDEYDCRIVERVSFDNAVCGCAIGYLLSNFGISFAQIVGDEAEFNEGTSVISLFRDHLERDGIAAVDPDALDLMTLIQDRQDSAEKYGYILDYI